MHYARSSVAILRSSPIPWNALGLCFVKRGQVGRGLEHFLAAYELDPKFSKAAYNIACCYSLLGDTDRALKYLPKGLDSYRRVTLAETDPELNNVRDLPEFRLILEEARGKLQLDS